MGYTSSFISVILMALAGPLMKLAMATMDASLVLFFSTTSACIAALIGILLTKKISMSRPPISILILSSLYMLAMISFVFALKNENPLLVNLIARSNLFFSFLFAFIFLKDRLNLVKSIGLTFILLGTLAISIKQETQVIHFSFGVILSFAYALFFSSHNALLKMWSGISSLELLLYQNGLAAILIGLTLVLREKPIIISTPSLWFAFLAGILSSFFGFIFYHQGISRLSLSEASTVRSLSPIIGIAIIYPFFPMTFSIYQQYAVMIIITGSVIFNLRRPDARQTTN